MADRESLLSLVAEIVSSHVRHNAVASNELPTLVERVFDALHTAEGKTVESGTKQPAVPVRQSVTRSPRLSPEPITRRVRSHYFVTRPPPCWSLFWSRIQIATRIPICGAISASARRSLQLAICSIAIAIPIRRQMRNGAITNGSPKSLWLQYTTHAVSSGSSSGNFVARG